MSEKISEKRLTGRRKARSCRGKNAEDTESVADRMLFGLFGVSAGHDETSVDSVEIYAFERLSSAGTKHRGRAGRQDQAVQEWSAICVETGESWSAMRVLAKVSRTRAIMSTTQAS